jgi:CRP-like cAMP-binding protein
MPELLLLAEREQNQGQVCDLIRRSGFFPDLEPDEINMLAYWMKAYMAKAGTLILKEGQEGVASLCIIVDGKVNIFKQSSPNDDHVKIAEIDSGASIGEMSVVDGLPFSASAISLVDTTILIMTRDDFQNLLKKNSNLGIKILFRVSRLISERLRTTTGRLADLLAVMDKNLT